MNSINSGKPKKQRKFHYGKPLHKKQAATAAHLDKKLRAQLGMRHIPVRKGDTVKVMRGTKKGSIGKVTALNYLKGTIFIEKVARKKANGEEVLIPVHASNLLVTELEKSDSKRFKGKTAKQQRKEKEPGAEKREDKGGLFQ